MASPLVDAGIHEVHPASRGERDPESVFEAAERRVAVGLRAVGVEGRDLADPVVFRGLEDIRNDLEPLIIDGGVFEQDGVVAFDPGGSGSADQRIGVRDRPDQLRRFGELRERDF